MTTAAPHAAPTRMHLPSLLAAIAIMLVGTLYPPLMADTAGKANHPLALALFLAMSAGLIRGVGFVPRHLPWRIVFSGWACAAALTLALYLKVQH